MLGQPSPDDAGDLSDRAARVCARGFGGLDNGSNQVVHPFTISAKFSRRQKGQDRGGEKCKT